MTAECRRHMDVSRVVFAAVPSVLALAAAALLVDAWRTMKVDQSVSSALVTQSGMEQTYTEQLTPTLNEPVESLTLTDAANDTTCAAHVDVKADALTDAQLAAFDANVLTVARFAQRHRRCVRLDTTALASVKLVMRAASLLLAYSTNGAEADVLDEKGEAPPLSEGGGSGQPLLSGLLCHGAKETLMWVTRLQHEVIPSHGCNSEDRGGAEKGQGRDGSPLSLLARPHFPLSVVLSSPPETATDLGYLLRACRIAQVCTSPGQAPLLTCACAVATLNELDALQALLLASPPAQDTDHAVDELTIFLGADLTYRTAPRTVEAAAYVYQWALARTKAAALLRTPADVMAAETSIASWNHTQRQASGLAPSSPSSLSPLLHARTAPARTTVANAIEAPTTEVGDRQQKSRLPLLGLAGFLLTNRRTTVNRYQSVSMRRPRTFYDYVVQTLRRWGNALGWVALHSPVLYPIVYLLRRHARRDAVVRVTELIQWYVFGGTSLGDDRIYCPRPPGAINMRVAKENSGEGGEVGRATADHVRNTVFRVIEEEDLYVIHERLPLFCQRPTTDAMRGVGEVNSKAGDDAAAKKLEQTPTSASNPRDDCACQASEEASAVIPLTTDPETLVVVECTVGAKTLYRGLSATISGLKELM